jgi:hypothetical protein
MEPIMNERISKLAEQAGIEFTYDPTEVPMRAFIEAWEGDLEKFAELIVRECAAIDFYKRTGISLKDNYGVTRTILEHFGVEE